MTLSCLGFARLFESVNICLSPYLESFYSLFLSVPIAFLFYNWDSSETNVRYFSNDS